MTVIPGTSPAMSFGLSKGMGGEHVFLRMPHLTGHVSRFGIDVGVKKSDLKDALRQEFGWIVIEKSELPEVGTEEVESGTRYVVEHAGNRDRSVWGDVKADAVRRHALRYLAMAEYLEAQPKIDPADVATLAAALGDTLGGSGYLVAAEKLLASGKVEVKK